MSRSTRHNRDSKRLLLQYCEGYLALMREADIGEILSRQKGGIASLGLGAGGVSYLFLMDHHLQGGQDSLEQAERWWQRSIEESNSPVAFLEPAASRDLAMPIRSLLFGGAGLCYLDLLLAILRGDRERARRALSCWRSLLSQCAEGQLELNAGLAGNLAGAATALALSREQCLVAFGSELAARLENCVILETGGSVRWPNTHGEGVAHGTAGIMLSFLLWSEASGSLPPWWLKSGIAILLEETLMKPTRLCALSEHRSFLCGGFAGLCVLAVQAFRLYKEEPFLAAARGAAHLALEFPSKLPDLCCGRAGAAAACFSLATIDPDGAWLARGQELALSCLLCERSTWPVAGLYGGEAGLAWLALQVRTGAFSGPPGLDLIRA